MTIYKCGCGESGKINGKPGCVIHGSVEPAEPQPDLSQRRMRCAYGVHGEAPSDPKSAFFKYEPSRAFDTFYCGCCGWD